MASNDDDSHDAWSNKRQSHQNDYERRRREFHDELGHSGSHGHFTAFKRFIDDNVSTLAHTFRKFPSNLAELRADMQQEQHRQAQEEKDISRRWTGCSDSSDHIAMQLNRMDSEGRGYATWHTKEVLKESARLNMQIPLSKIVKLYEDREAGMGLLDSLASPLLALGGTWYFMPETGDTLPTASNWSLWGNTARWLSIDWFKRSPYSPIQLEAHPDLRQVGAKWRMAFEDLLLASLDKPMIDFNPHQPLNYVSSGIDWVFDLQQRGSLPPLLPRFYGDSTARRVLEHTSILDIIRKCHAPWASEQSSPWLDSLSRDFAELRTEAATTVAIDNCDLALEPTTELQIYEFHDRYQNVLEVLGMPTGQRIPWSMFPESGRPETTGDCEEHEEEEEEDDDDDSDLAHEYRERAMQIQEWQRIRDEAGLVLSGDNREEELWEAAAAYEEAMRRGDDIAAANIVVKWMVTYHEDAGAFLGMVRPEDLAGTMELLMGWKRQAETVSEEEREEALEQQRENLERMVGEREEEEPVEIHGQKKVEVLSALTTTQTTRLPDGTVTTKVVLKKRFADGRREESESVYTTNEIAEAEVKRKEEEEKKKAGNGWFWS